MTDQNQLLREALHDIEQAHDLSLDLDHYASRQVLVSLADKIKVALAAQPAEGGEAVAEVPGISDYGQQRFFESLAHLPVGTKLYTAPPASQELEARKAAQEQLYAERERHTADVKKLQAEIGRLQAEIGRLQALRPVTMTPSEVTEAFDSELRSSYTDFEAGIRTAEIHHHITQKEQG